jgi:hypothetical protein
MLTHIIKRPDELAESDIQIILTNWEVDEWKQLTPEEFRKRFEDSEFHLLNGEDSRLLSVARINFRFKVSIHESVYDIAELVGFITVEVLKGYGKILLGLISDNLKERNIEAIGFCRRRTAPYYESAGFKVLRDKVKHLREKKGDDWFTPSEDDDIIAINLSEHRIELFEKISDERPAYLLF